MKLQAQSSRDLSVAFCKSAKCIATKNTIAILDNVLLSKHEDGKFYFTSATPDSQLTIPAPLTLIEGNFAKPIALPIDTIGKFVSSLPDCAITFVFVDEKNVVLEYCTTVGDKVKTGKVSLTYFNGENFPTMAEPATATLHISLPGTVFRDVIEKSRKFISCVPL